MKTNMQNRATNGMFLLNNYSTTIYTNAIQQESESQVEALMIESIIETIVEPIIYKC